VNTMRKENLKAKIIQSDNFKNRDYMVMMIMTMITITKSKFHSSYNNTIPACQQLYPDRKDFLSIPS